MKKAWKSITAHFFLTVGNIKSGEKKVSKNCAFTFSRKVYKDGIQSLMLVLCLHLFFYKMFFIESLYKMVQKYKVIEKGKQRTECDHIKDILI